MLLQQNREYRVVLANEDHTTALRSERRLAAREWSDKLLHLQSEADRERKLKEQAQTQLTEERKVGMRELLIEASANESRRKSRVWRRRC